MFCANSEASPDTQLLIGFMEATFGSDWAALNVTAARLMSAADGSLEQKFAASCREAGGVGAAAAAAKVPECILGVDGYLAPANGALNEFCDT